MRRGESDKCNLWCRYMSTHETARMDIFLKNSRDKTSLRLPLRLALREGHAYCLWPLPRLLLYFSMCTPLPFGYHCYSYYLSSTRVLSHYYRLGVHVYCLWPRVRSTHTKVVDTNSMKKITVSSSVGAD